MDENRYTFSKEQMIRIATAIGTGHWYFDRGSLFAETSSVSSLLVTYISFLGTMMFIKEGTIITVIMYWALLCCGGAWTLYLKDRWKALDKQKYIDETHKAMMLDLEDAEIRHQIQELTDNPT